MPPTTHLETDTATPWWGEVEIPEGLAGRWRVGSLGLWIENRPWEWRLAYAEDSEESTAVEALYPQAPEEPPAAATVVRIVNGRDETELKLSPALADRPIVARPETPFRLRSQGEVALYLSTPLWVRVESTDPPGVILDVPCRRPSDTWFGPSTLEGELCYAIRTRARLDFDNVAVRPDRAITKMRLRNLADDDLLLERLNLPAPSLSLSVDARGHLWTQEVTLAKQHGGKLAEIHFAPGPPPDAGDCRPVAGPRTREHRNVLERALGALLG